MRRLLPKVWCIAMCSISICGYSRDFTFYESASESLHNVTFFQSATITGKVLDEAGLGMPGVNVIVKGTSVGTTTDAEGAYRLSVTQEQAAGTLVFSFIGYAVQEQPINNRSSINISMVADISELTEVVVVGYGTQEKRVVTSSISTVTGEAIAAIPVPNVMDAMKGQIAGVDILQNGGAGEAPTIRVRGRRSLAAGNDPLYVVDGIPLTSGTNPIQDFNPADIESVEVLKDAASQAIYGSRGSNGVILVTTKKGRRGSRALILLPHMVYLKLSEQFR